MTASFYLLCWLHHLKMFKLFLREILDVSIICELHFVTGFIFLRCM